MALWGVGRISYCLGWNNYGNGDKRTKLNFRGETTWGEMTRREKVLGWNILYSSYYSNITQLLFLVSWTAFWWRKAYVALGQRAIAEFDPAKAPHSSRKQSYDSTTHACRLNSCHKCNVNVANLCSLSWVNPQLSQVRKLMDYWPLFTEPKKAEE